MEVIVSKRREGKTTRMIQKMKETPNGVLVCISMNRVKDLQYENKDVQPNRFITMDQVRHGILQGSRSILFIEDLDHYIYEMLRGDGSQIAAVSITED